MRSITDHRHPPYIQKTVEGCLGFFQDHEATLEEFSVGGKSLRKIRWAKPGTRIMAVDLLIDRTTLYVSGDCHAATYCWSGPAEDMISFLADLELSYFSEKCEASPRGQQFRSWNEEECRRHLHDLFIQRARDLRDEYDDPRERSAKIKAIMESLPGLESAADSERDFMDAITDDDNAGAVALFGTDAWEYHWMGDCIDRGCVVHWVAVTLACRAAIAKAEGREE